MYDTRWVRHDGVPVAGVRAAGETIGLYLGLTSQGVSLKSATERGQWWHPSILRVATGRSATHGWIAEKLASGTAALYCREDRQASLLAYLLCHFTLHAVFAYLA